MKNTVYRRGSEEHNIRAEVVFALTAELAVTAGLARLQRNAVADFQMLDSTANFHDCAARLVAQHERWLDHIIADRTRFIVVHIAAADANVFQLDKSSLGVGIGRVV